TNCELSTAMKSVGEVMSIGRTFNESLQKALRSLETGLTGLDEVFPKDTDIDYIKSQLAKLLPNRLLIVADAMRFGVSIEEINSITGYDFWFLYNIKQIILAEQKIKEGGLPETAHEILQLKKMGFSDARLAKLSRTEMTSEQIESIRKKFDIKQVYKRVDTCAAEFESSTAYMYGCYEGDVVNKTECEASVSNRNKVVILGSGPNRIGQGIEFDYACVHAVSAAKEMGFETIMINCNPETVSTDYDTADRLYFAPLVAEDVLEILEKEQENGLLVGIIVQIGGQTPLKLAKVLNERGGQSMSIKYNIESFKEYVLNQTKIFEHGPLLIDRFLVNAVEVDVDAVCDGENVFIAAIMEHIEEAGIHSGDSTCSMPTNTLDNEIIKEIKSQTTKIARALRVI
ncbi:Pre-ATP-grasp domain,Carbamoyl-phosphate synthetase large subunit-like, ATP-binding, partial [Cinara cedri]